MFGKIKSESKKEGCSWFFLKAQRTSGFHERTGRDLVVIKTVIQDFQCLRTVIIPVSVLLLFQRTVDLNFEL
jgi:hypothetical protein